MRVEKASTVIRCALPIYSSAVSAGFPSPAEDYLESKLDLNEHLIQHPSATFMVRATGDSMTGVGIFSGDILIVDRSVQAKHGSIIIAVINAELTVKRLYRRKGVIKLEAANPAYPSLNVSDDMELWCWGVVTAAIHQYGSAAMSRSLDNS
jgi:DNA polymerase V